MNGMKKLIRTNVQSNPLNYIDPFGLMQAWTTVPKGHHKEIPDLSTADNCPKDCPFDGNKCDCPGDSCDIDPSSGAYICGGETVEVIAKEEPADIGFISEWLAFLVWASQPSMHKPWEFIPNYKDPMVQIMAQVSSNVQQWLDYGELYIKLNLFLLTFGEPFLSTKVITFKSSKGIGFKLISRISTKDLLKIAYHPGHIAGPHTYKHLMIYIRYLGKTQIPPS